jgi:DNA-binding MurR/RpiR family transcriptional regulator
MKSAKQDLFDKIISIYPTLSPKKRRVADLVMKDYKKIFLMTAREIAVECQVSEPTIIRFTVDMGFSGYTAFLQYMKGLLHTELTSAERLSRTSRKPDEGTTIQRYCQNAIQNLENLTNAITEAEFKKLARTIHAASPVYVVGYRASATLAYHFGYLLKKVKENVKIDTNVSWQLMDALNGCDKKALLIVIAFPRYPRRSVEILKYAKNCQVPTLGFSDNPRSPITTLSDQYAILDIEGVSFIDPFAHIIAFLGALVHEIAFIDEAGALRCISKFDEGVKKADEFYTEENTEEELAYHLDRPHIASLWPQKKQVKETAF